MKKASFLFFILLAVFFSYKNAYAFTFQEGNLTLDASSSYISSFDENYGATLGSFQYRTCAGTDYGTCANRIGNGIGSGGQMSDYTISGLPLSGYWFLSSEPDGYYYIEFYNNNTGLFNTTTGDGVYYTFSRIGGVWTAIGNTPLDGISTQLTPISGSNVQYYVHFTGTYNNNTGIYTAIFGSFSDTTTGTASSDFYLIPNTAGTSLPYDFIQPLTPAHYYEYSLRLYDGNSGAYTPLTPAIPFSTSALDTIPTGAWTPATCTWGDFTTWGGCFTNIAQDIFYPSSESLSQFNGLYSQYINKPPFGYVSAIITQLKAVNDTGTAIFTLQTLPILDTYIFTPLRTAFAWILWLGFAFLLFKRFKDIQL